MGKSWRLSAVFGALFAICGIAYLLSSNPATTPIQNMDPRVLGLAADQVVKLEVERKDGTLVFEKSSDSVGEYWRIAGPASHAADPALVQQMLYGLDRFLKAGALDPQRPEAAPDRTGMGDPRLTVAFSGADRREVLRFGKSPAANTTVVCYQHEGDPRIYLVGVDTFEAFNKPPLQYRAKAVARFAPHRVNKVVLEAKFLHPQGPNPVEYERSVIERFEEGLERGWYLTEPYREKLDDHAVAGLVTELSALEAGDYQAPGDPKAQGFDQPAAKVTVYSNGDDHPVEFLFGDSAQREKKRWVRLAGSPEIGLCDAFRFEALPLQRNYLRNRTMFGFTQELCRRIEVEAKGLGRVVLERRDTKKADEVVSTSKWELVEPAGLKIEQERMDAFVVAVVSEQIENFLGEQNFKQAGLDPGPVRLRIETREGKTHSCEFSTAGYFRKDDVKELFQVRPEFVRLLERLELNFLNMDLFNVPRSAIHGFEFESQVSNQLQRVFYRMELPAGKDWIFTDPGHKGAEADPTRVGDLLTMLNFIKAEALLGRDREKMEKYKLTEAHAPATLRIFYTTGDERSPKQETAEIYISEDQSAQPTVPLYYARFKDSSTVFQISGLLIVTLKQVPVLKK